MAVLHTESVCTVRITQIESLTTEFPIGAQGVRSSDRQPTVVPQYMIIIIIIAGIFIMCS